MIVTRPYSLSLALLLLLSFQAGGSSPSLTISEQLTIVKEQNQILLSHIEKQIRLRDSLQHVESQLDSSSLARVDSMFGIKDSTYGGYGVKHASNTTR